MGEKTIRMPAPREEIRVGISSCLVGQHVRYDGGHKKDDLVTEFLARFVRFVPVCPEVELGMGTPRETIRLERHGDVVRLVAPGSAEDHTESMRRYAEKRVSELERMDLSGYVLKSGSPSCGLERVRVWGKKTFACTGRGAFATVLLARLPLLPVEEEGWLHDLPLLVSFVDRIVTYHLARRVKTSS